MKNFAFILIASVISLTFSEARAADAWNCFATCTQFMRGTYGGQPVEIYVQHFKVGGAAKERAEAFKNMKKSCQDLTAQDLSFSVDLQLRTIELGGSTIIHDSTISATEGNSCVKFR